MIAAIVRRAAKVVLCAFGVAMLAGAMAAMPYEDMNRPEPWAVILWAVASLAAALWPVPAAERAQGHDFNPRRGHHPDPSRPAGPPPSGVGSGQRR